MVSAYIFDQDGTLYPKNSDLFRTLRSATKRWLQRELKLNGDEIERLYLHLQETYPNPFDGFASLGLSVEDYHTNVFKRIDPNRYVEKDDKLIEVFHKVKQPKYIVTFAPRNYSRKLQRALGISDSVAETLFVSEFLPQANKLVLYEKISENLALAPRDICVVGDNYATDILPALENGFKTILIGDDFPQYNGVRIPNIYALLSIGT